MRNREILKTLANMYDGPFSTEPCVTLACLELDVYSETCQISMMENFIQKHV